MNIDELNLRHLRWVVTLSEELNFGKAAERLRISQPPLTRLVVEVEEAVGARLFDRTTRRVTLTPVGEVFVAEARSVLTRMEEALRQVENSVRKQSVQVRLVYTPLAFLTVLPPILSQFRGRQAEARVDLLEMPTGTQRRALLTGRADMAFADEPFRADEFESACLHREPLSVVLPDDHPFANRSSITLKELRNETFILHPRAEYPEYYDRFFAACAAVGFTPKVRYREAGQDVLDLLLNGGGLLFTPEYHAPSDIPELRPVAIESPLPLYAEVWAIWLKRIPAPPVKTLIDIAREVAGKQA